MLDINQEIFDNLKLNDSIFIEPNYNVDENDPNTRVPRELFDISNKLFNQYEFYQEYGKNKTNDKEKYRKLNIIFIINLFNAYFKKKSVCCPKDFYYYRNSIIMLVENCKFVRGNLIKKHIDTLALYDLINVRNGYYDRTRVKRNYVTRITPKQKLIDIFNNCNVNYSIDPEYLMPFSDHLLGVFKPHKKDTDGRRIKSPQIHNIPETLCGLNAYQCKKKIRKVLKTLKPKIQYYNDEVQKRSFEVDYDNQLEERLSHLIDRNLIEINYMSGSIISPDVFKIRIIYNNSSLTQGGRAYNQFQLFSKILRKKTKINNSNVNLVDLSGCHIRMLYHINDMDIEKEDLYDIYWSDDPQYNKVLREITKVAILIIINAKSMSANILTLKNKIIEEFQREYNVEIKDIEDQGFLEKDFIKKWFHDVMNQFSEVKQYFFTGIGLSLQNIEGKIIFNTMYELLADYNTLSLPVHDELVVPFEKSELARDIILKNYESFELLNGFLPRIKIT